MRQYIGARYVTKIYENSLDPSSAEWEPGVNYEPITMVTFNNGSYLSKKKVPANIGDPSANPSYWVQTGFYNGQIAYLQNQIDTINGILNGIGTDISNLEEGLKLSIIDKSELTCNLVLNDIYQQSSLGNVQGSCYVGNNKIVAYIAPNSGNTGILRCYNMSTFTIEWEHSIVGYHGNSITYNPSTNKIYITGCYSNPGTVYNNAIIEISMSDPATVIRTFALDDMSIVYSMAYDTETDRYYAISVGGGAGVADVVYIYDADFAHVDTLTLKKHAAVYFGFSNQGVQLVKNGYIFIPSYDASGLAVYAHDITTGDLVAVRNIPRFINNCRNVGEIQSLLYNTDTDQFIVCSNYSWTGLNGWAVANFFEVDMFKGVYVITPEASNIQVGQPVTTIDKYVIVVPAGNTLKPSWLINAGLFTVPNDAFDYAQFSNLAVDVYFKHSDSGVSSQGDEVLYAPNIRNFNGQIYGFGSSDNLKVKHAIVESGHIIFTRCDFVDYFAVYGTTYCNILINLGGTVTFNNGDAFDDIDSGTGYHIFLQNNSKGYAYNPVFNGSGTNYSALSGSSITIEP